MNLWKPLALVSMSAMALTVGYQAAYANKAPDATPAVGDQPNMQAALGQLQAARASLEHAEHDKGGWRTAAIRAAETAIAETKRGMAFAASH